MQTLMHRVTADVRNSERLAPNPTPRRFVAGRTGGDLVIKAATARVIAAVRRVSLEQAIEDLYGKRNDQRLLALVRAASSTADTTTPGWAKELIGADVQGFLASLPNSVFAALAQRAFTVELSGVGSVSV